MMMNENMAKNYIVEVSAWIVVVVVVVVQVQVLYVVLHAPATASTLLVSYLGSQLLNSAH